MDKLCKTCAHWQGHKKGGTLWEYGECGLLNNPDSFDWRYCEDEWDVYEPEFSTPASFGCILWEEEDSNES